MRPGEPDTRPRLTCSACHGEGHVIGPCKTCHGAGNVRTKTSSYACPDCGNFRCLRCGGSGREIANG